MTLNNDGIFKTGSCKYMWYPYYILDTAFFPGSVDGPKLCKNHPLSSEAQRGGGRVGGHGSIKKKIQNF